MYEVSVNNKFPVSQPPENNSKMYLELKDLGLCTYFWFCLFYAIKWVLVKIFDLESSPNKCI